ncbi:MAG: 5-methylthioadenosine/S-adenosylhomocysteine deaminase [Cognaticolwellia sp.]
MEQHFTELTALDTPEWAARGIVPVIAPHATDTVSPALWRRCRDLAVKTGWPVHFHIAQSAEELERSWAHHGCGPVEMLAQNGLLDADIRLLMVHALYLSEAELDLLDGDRHTLGYCPAAQSQFDFPNPVERWRTLGLPVVLGTDAGSCNDTMDPQAELRMMASGPGFGVSHGQALADFVRTPDPAKLKALRAARSVALGQRLGNVELLASVTSTPGNLHPDMPVGVIEAGRWANLQVVDLSAPSLWPGTDALQALCYGQTQPALWGLMVRGRWIGQPGNLRRGLLDTTWWRESQADARERLDAVIKRSGI